VRTGRSALKMPRAITPVAGLFFESLDFRKSRDCSRTNFLEGNLDESQEQFTSELLVPVKWIGRAAARRHTEAATRHQGRSYESYGCTPGI